MKAYKRVVLISRGDTCIGPMSAGLLRRAATDKSIEIVSRGARVLFAEPMNEKAEAVLIGNGIKGEKHAACALSEEDFNEDTILVAMSAEIYRLVADKWGAVDNMYLLEGLIGEQVELPIPYGQDLPVYGACFETLEKWMDRLAAAMEKWGVENDQEA